MEHAYVARVVLYEEHPDRYLIRLTGLSRSDWLFLQSRGNVDVGLDWIAPY